MAMHGAHAGQWRSAAGRVAKQGNAPDGPAIHANLAEGIEVIKIGRLIEIREQPWRLPLHVGKDLAQQLLLRIGIAAKRVACGAFEAVRSKVEGCLGGAAAPVAKTADTLAELHVVATLVVKMEIVGNGEDGQIVSHVVENVCLVRKSQRTGVGVKAVSADHEIEAVAVSAGKGDIDSRLGSGW